MCLLTRGFTETLIAVFNIFNAILDLLLKWKKRLEMYQTIKF